MATLGTGSEPATIRVAESAMILRVGSSVRGNLPKGESPWRKIVSEDGSWWPKTWNEAIPNTVWGILSLGFGLDFITNVISGNFGHALIALIGLGALIAMLVHRDQLKSRLQSINANWIVAVFFTFWVALILSPFIEQQRWPFSFPDPQLAAENQRLVGELASARIDAQYFHFAYNLRNGARASNGERLSCSFTLGVAQDSASQHLWGRVQPLLDFAHWNQNSTPIDPSQVTGSGVSILVGSAKSDAFVCGTSLARELRNTFGVNPQVLTDQTTPALVACEFKCLELGIGHL